MVLQPRWRSMDNGCGVRTAHCFTIVAGTISYPTTFSWWRASRRRRHNARRLQSRLGATGGRDPGMAPQPVGANLCWYPIKIRPTRGLSSTAPLWHGVCRSTLTGVRRGLRFSSITRSPAWIQGYLWPFGAGVWKAGSARPALFRKLKEAIRSESPIQPHPPRRREKQLRPD